MHHVRQPKKQLPGPSHLAINGWFREPTSKKWWLYFGGCGCLNPGSQWVNIHLYEGSPVNPLVFLVFWLSIWPTPCHGSLWWVRWKLLVLAVNLRRGSCKPFSFTKLQQGCVVKLNGEIIDISGLLGFSCCIIFWGSNILEMKLSTFWRDFLWMGFLLNPCPCRSNKQSFG